MSQVRLITQRNIIRPLLQTINLTILLLHIQLQTIYFQNVLTVSYVCPFII